jgi:hypothetical protein
MSARGSFRRTDQVAVLLPLPSLYAPIPQWLAAMKVASITLAAFPEPMKHRECLSSGVVRLQFHPVALVIPAISAPVKLPRSNAGNRTNSCPPTAPDG